MTAPVTTGPPPPIAPAAASWGQDGDKPVAGTRAQPAVIVAIAVAAVIAIGAAIALINAGGDDAGPKAPPVVGSTENPIDPTEGPAEAPDVPATPDLPGPQPPGTIGSSTTLPPVSVPPPDTPSLPADLRTQTVLGEVSVAVPDGWDVLLAEDGKVTLLHPDGGGFMVRAGEVDPGITDASALAQEYRQEFLDGLDDMQVFPGGDAPVPFGSFVSGHVFTYEAVLVSQQGSVVVDGTVLAYVTSDGLGIVMETFTRRGDAERFAGDYLLMVNSVLISTDHLTE